MSKIMLALFNLMTRWTMVYYLIYYYYCSVVLSFNLDIHAPIYKIGPNNSYFGFSVAEHFKENLPVILVGAPKAESGQPGTEHAGAVYSCSITARYTQSAASKKSF
ncbi:Integrin alpha ina-1 [Dirofilaria immitis]